MTGPYGHEPGDGSARISADAAPESRPRSRPRDGSGGRHDPDRLERRLRARAAGFVALMLAGVLIAGAVVRAAPPRAAGADRAGQLPSVSSTSHSSVEWACPGPLPAGASPDRSEILVVNPGRGPARVLVDVAAVGAARAPAASGEPLRGWTARLELAPLSERVVALARSGPAQNDAVSVLSTAGAVAVFESVLRTGTQEIGHHSEPLLSIPEQSPCSTGAATRSYLASGSTEDESDVIVSLFDPTATQAVAAIRVSTESGSVTPPALQGLIVKPYSLQVFDIARSVVQQASMAITVTTTAGSVAAGASETIASDATATTSASGSALVIGIGAPQDRWVLTPGLGMARRTVGVRVYDPGPHAAIVTISSPVKGRSPIEITQVVPAGEVRAIDLPAPPGSVKKEPNAPARGHGASPVAEGPIVVATARGVGVLVSRIAALTVGSHAETVAFAAVSSVPANNWVVPAAATGTSASGGIVISNPGLETVHVEVAGFSPGGGAASTTQFAKLTIPPMASATAPLFLPASEASFAGVLVTASGQVVAEQDFFALGTPHDPVPVTPVPVEGIPVIG